MTAEFQSTSAVGMEVPVPGIRACDDAEDEGGVRHGSGEGTDVF